MVDVRDGMTGNRSLWNGGIKDTAHGSHIFQPLVLDLGLKLIHMVCTQPALHAGPRAHDAQGTCAGLVWDFPRMPVLAPSVPVQAGPGCEPHVPPTPAGLEQAPRVGAVPDQGEWVLDPACR